MYRDNYPNYCRDNQSQCSDKGLGCTVHHCVPKSSSSLPPPCEETVCEYQSDRNAHARVFVKTGPLWAAFQCINPSTHPAFSTRSPHPPPVQSVKEKESSRTCVGVIPQGPLSVISVPKLGFGTLSALKTAPLVATLISTALSD